MNAEERREARRRRILENSEIRLKKITSITTDENVLNEQTEIIKDKQENNNIKPELSDWTIPKHHNKEPTENLNPNVFKDKTFFNYKTNFSSKLHSKSFNYEIKISSITVLHMVLSQIILALFYYDLGFLFGNSVIVPFLPSAIIDFYTSKQQHNNVNMVVLSGMMGIPQNFAKQISKCLKLATIILTRFCVYIFCFTCSYAFLLKFTNPFYDVTL
ncbi:Hypothetical protein CINCED_3A001837 [Cinara cedri]|nr:Hypothetical protein CINCED_3A001837 [Cinara cedri]